LAIPGLRDRDAIVTRDGLILRVFGYSHLPEAYICDVEYAPAKIFRSDNPKALRDGGQGIFCKFYEDEGWKFVQSEFRQYMIFHEVLDNYVAGVNYRDIDEVRKPELRLRNLIERKPNDELVAAMQRVLKAAMQHSGLSTENFGVFGSLLHGFHHPRFSDIDLIIYGGKNAIRLCQTLQELYELESSPLRNEFKASQSMEGRNWRFHNLSTEEYVWHQRRKLIYALFKDQESGRIIKAEFEPVKEWKEIANEYDSEARILKRGWIKMLARVTEDSDAPFIPSIYGIEPLEVLEGAKEALEVRRIVSYIEEFRMQAHKDEVVYVEGNLEEVATSKSSFYQVALTYCPRYYEQVLKCAKRA